MSMIIIEVDKARTHSPNFIGNEDTVCVDESQFATQLLNRKAVVEGHYLDMKNDVESER